MDKALVEKLFSLRRFGIKPGLDRIRFVLDKIGNPHEKLHIFHIAGTNGKGSVASILASVLTEAGYKIGLYTSPHIFSFNERIRVNGRPISDENLEPRLIRLMNVAEEVDATFFEITTALAFDYFHYEKVDFVVLETGLGGKFDATNVISHPILTVLTKIDLDHEQYLGHTIEEIASEKAGIIKPPHPVIIGPNNRSVYSAVFSSVNQKDNLLLAEYLTELTRSEYSKFTFPPQMILTIHTINNKIDNLVTSLLGVHQLENIATSLIAIETVQIPLGITEEHIRLGLKNIVQNTGLHCRIEFLQIEPSFVVDVAHNPNAVRSTIETLRQIESETKWNVMFAAMKDKNIERMVSELLPYAKRFLLANLSFNRAEVNNNIREILDKELTKSDIKPKPEIILFETASQALKFCLELKEPTLVIGSFYLIGEIVVELKQALDWNIELVGENFLI